MKVHAHNLNDAPQEVRDAFGKFENKFNLEEKQRVLARAKCIFETSKKAFDSDFIFQTPSAKEAFYKMPQSVQEFMILQRLVKKSNVVFGNDVMIVPTADEGGHNYELYFPHLHSTEDVFVKWHTGKIGNHMYNCPSIMRPPLLEEVVAYLVHE